jgi:hypothetical protein
MHPLATHLLATDHAAEIITKAEAKSVIFT